MTSNHAAANEPGAFEEKPEVWGYEAVRAAARDYATYSSLLTGDTRVRSYRQLPLELDPPRHSDVRLAIQPMFSAENVSRHDEAFRELARALIDDVKDRGHAELGADVALPYVVGCLAELFNRHQDVDEWVSWGPMAWHADAYMAGEEITEATKRSMRDRDYSNPDVQTSANTIDAYLTRVFDEADASQNVDVGSMDIWDVISNLIVDGRPLTREEKVGMGCVLLTGGRETVIKLITGLVWHLIRSPGDREYLTNDADARPAAIAELNRYLSPLPRMERVVLSGAPTPACPAGRTGGYRVILSFVSANFDTARWNDPETLDIHRERKANLGFGFGRHSCLGVKLTEHEVAAFLDVVLDDWPGWAFAAEPTISWYTIGEGETAADVIDAFDSVPIVARA